MKTVIFDLDGTLALIDKRRNLAYKNKVMDWDIFFNPENIKLDEPNQPVIDMYHNCKAMGFDVIIFSGRSDRTKKETEKWLSEHVDENFDLTMRKDNDTRDDRVIKTEWLDDRFDSYDEIHSVFDDRNKVVKMWRDLGITCFQVEYGDF